MGQCFEIFRLTTELRSWTGSTFCDDLELTGEAERRFNEILSAYGENSFKFMIGLNKSFNSLNVFPWAIIAFEKQYLLRGYVTATRPAYADILLGGYSLPRDSSPENRGSFPVSMLFIRNKRTFSQLDFQSPLYASFHDLLVDKDPNRYWICFPEALPEEWVRQQEAVDAELYAWFNGNNPPA